MITIKRTLLVVLPILGLVAACSTSSSNGGTTTDGGSSSGSSGTSGTSGSSGSSGSSSGSSGSSSGSSGSSGDAGPAGGPVNGAADTHCSSDAGPMTQSVSPASCTPDSGVIVIDAGPAPDGGAPMYGDTMFNAEGDDDDCKYHVKWTSSPIRQGTDVTFTVTVTTKDGTPGPMRPLPGEGSNGLYPIRAEVFLTDIHPAPNTTQKSVETATPGTYTVGPIRFDAAGKWTVRFHFHEMCSDLLPDSPHGHAAFFVQLP